MLLFDSVQKKKVLFEPIISGQASIYVCGPTVYDNAHLGHARSSLVFDLLRRVLETEGYIVTFVKNITDIDDKIINKSLETGLSINTISETYTESYHRDMDEIGVKRPTIEPKATESIKVMIDMIQTLLDKKYAYMISNGDIYFNTAIDKNYFSISNRKSFEYVSRIESISEKKNPSDFALWKKVTEGVSFDSPFGKGRPGWHIECSAMIKKHFPENNSNFAIDIHGGGSDLLFPHHENEAAQTRCATNKELSKYWIHNGFVNIQGEKMSKSLGNSLFIQNLLESYDGEVLRFYLLGTHYRSDFNFKTKDLIVAKERLDKLYRLKRRVFGLKAELSETNLKKELLIALSDDLNISQAYALIDSFIVKSNNIIDNKGDISIILSGLLELEDFLGFGLKNPFEYFQFGISETLKNEINELINRRSIAKKNKNFELADEIRKQLLSQKISVLDTVYGTFWEKI